jgi:PAS domain S-box-containing protein
MLHKLDTQGRFQRSVVGMKFSVSRVGLSIAVGLAYFLAAQLGLALLTSAERVAVFWPASGIAVGTLIVLGPWARVPVVAAVMAASIVAALLSDRSVWSAVAFALCNAGEALIVMWLMERWFGPAFSLDSLRRVLGFFAAAAVATATAAVGASGAMMLFGPSTAAFLDIWEVWFTSDALGIMTVAPLLIGIAAAVRDVPSWRELLEGTLAVAAVTATIGVLLAILSGPWSLVGPSSLLFPLLLWLGYRCRPVFAAAAVFIIAAAIVWTTTFEFGHYGDPTQPIAVRVFAAQIAILGITMAALALAALFAERRRSEAALGESDKRLRSVLDAANVIAWDVDLTRGAVHSAGPIARLLHRPESSVPRDFAAMVETIHPDDRDGVMAQFWTAVGTAATYRFEFRLNSDGLCWVTAEGSIERDADGRPVRVRGITHDITERRKAEMALAERDAQLRLAGKAARVGSFAIDISTGRVHNSPGYAAIHGLAEGTVEFPREEWRTRVHPDDLGRLDALRSQTFAARRHEHNTEYRLVSPHCGVRWIESRGLVSYDGNGRPIRLVGVNIDITERKQAEDWLQKSERKLRDLLGALPASIYVTDAEGYITYCNQSAVDLWGIKPVLGKDKWCDLAQFYHPDGSPMALADCPTEIALKQGHIVRGGEAILERKDGSRTPIDPYPTPLRDETGAIVGIVNMTVDISERKRAELALAERNIQLALAGKAVLVGSYAYDTDAEIMQISEGYAAIHGFPEGTTVMARSGCLAGVHPDDIGRVEQLRSAAFCACRREYSVEYRITRPGGEMRWVETRCFISYNGEGRAHRVVGVSIDMTERKRVEEQQGKLVAELDHRVKNVLATVQAVAARTMQASGSMEQFVAALDGRIRSMGSTHELLSHRRWLGIPLAELVTRELAPYTTGSNTEIGGPDVMLSAEAAQSVAMVLHELVTNAAKYGALSTRDGGASVRWYTLLNGDADARLCIEWEEAGGPEVQPSDRSGYGMEVIRGLLPYEFDGKVDLAFTTEGVRCRFDIPLSRLTGGDRRAGTFNGPAPTVRRLHD